MTLGALTLVAFALGGCLSASTPPWQLPPLRAQAAQQHEWLSARLERVLPGLMRKHGVQMWLVIRREYNEDPVSFSLVSPTMFAARRRTINVFNDRGGSEGVERLALGGGSNGGLYTVYRDPDNPGREIMGDNQWATLRKIIEQRKPASIAVDISTTHAFADGLSVGERQQLVDALGPEWMKRVVRAEALGIRVQKPSGEEVNFLHENQPVVIEPGDVLHADYGVSAMGMKTATQERMTAAGINGSIYSHSIGDHGHDAGPLIGLWDRQEGVLGRGDLPLLPNTWFSIELSVRTTVPEWNGRELFVGMEEDAAIDADGRIDWVFRRQTGFHLVR